MRTFARLRWSMLTRCRPPSTYRARLPRYRRFGRTAMVRRVVQHRAVGTEHPSGGGVAESYGSLHNRVEYWLHVPLCADHAENLARRCLLLGRIRLALPRLLQSLLELAELGAFALRRLAGNRAPGIGLRLRGLSTPTHLAAPSLSQTFRPHRDRGQARRRRPRGQAGWSGPRGCVASGRGSERSGRSPITSDARLDGRV